MCYFGMKENLLLKENKMNNSGLEKCFIDSMKVEYLYPLIDYGID
jgi:hypothetical protein